MLGTLGGRCLGGRPEEESGLEPFPPDREQRDDGQCPPAAVRGASTWQRNSPESPRAAFAIQKIIHVTRPTATIESVPPISSCASKVRPRGPKVSSAPNARLTTTATATPAQIAPQQLARARS